MIGSSLLRFLPFMKYGMMVALLKELARYLLPLIEATFSLNQRLGVMPSQITDAQLSNIHPLVHIPGKCASISIVAPFSQFTQTASFTGLQALSLESARGRFERTQEP